MFSGNYFFQGFYYSINMRKAIVMAMYNKVSRLSLKSLSETNSGKLITLISSDIFAVERNMQFAPMIISAPITNVVAYVIIGMTSGWIYTLIVFAMTVVMVAVQFALTIKTRAM